MFVDYDHAHDKLTQISITGLLVSLGITTVYLMSKRHGSIDTSIYGSEFCAISTTVKEVQVVRYMLRFLVVKVKHATFYAGIIKVLFIIAISQIVY